MEMLVCSPGGDVKQGAASTEGGVRDQAGLERVGRGHCTLSGLRAQETGVGREPGNNGIPRSLQRQLKSSSQGREKGKLGVCRKPKGKRVWGNHGE